MCLVQLIGFVEIMLVEISFAPFVSLANGSQFQIKLLVSGILDGVVEREGRSKFDDISHPLLLNEAVVVCFIGIVVVFGVVDVVVKLPMLNIWKQA